MTLILSRISDAYALQVTDRLVSQRIGTNNNPVDLLANKNILYIARDGVACFAYTGLAALGGKATDVWIAEQMTGLALEGSPCTRIDRTTVLTLHEVLTTLPSIMDVALRSSAVPLQLVIIGWRWQTRRRWRRAFPFYAKVTKLPKKEAVVEIAPRYWHYRRRLWFDASPSGSLENNAVMTLGSAISKLPEPDDASEALADAIRKVAESNKYVGKDCMSVAIAPPHIASVCRIRFMPFQVRTGSSRWLPGRMFPIAYSPFIVTPQMVVSPSEMSGGGIIVAAGPWRVEVFAPERTAEVLFTMQSQKRNPL